MKRNVALITIRIAYALIAKSVVTSGLRCVRKCMQHESEYQLLVLSWHASFFLSTTHRFKQVCILTPA